MAGNSASGAVVVLESDGVEIKRATTNVAGGYVLAGISPMTAGVVTLVGTGLYLSAGKPSTAAVSADAADVLTADVTAIKTELQTIDEVVFSDRNADGMRSGGEPGVPGVAVELRSASGSSWRSIRASSIRR